MSFLLSGLPISKEFIFPHESQKNIHNYNMLLIVIYGHDFHSAWADINLAWAVLRPGGVMFGHDYFTSADDRGVRRAVTLFAKVKGLTIRPHGQHWVLSPKPRGHGAKAR